MTPLICQAGRSRALALAKAKCHRVEQAHYTKVEAIEDLMLMRKEHYKKYRRDFDGAASSEASDDFEELLVKQNARYCEEYVDIVAVADIGRLRRVRGIRDAAVTSWRDGGGGSDEDGRSEHIGGMSRRSVARSARSQDTSLDRSHRRERSRRRHGPLGSRTPPQPRRGGSPDSKSPDCRTMSKPARMAASSASSASASLTSGALQRLEGKRELDTAGSDGDSGIFGSSVRRLGKTGSSPAAMAEVKPGTSTGKLSALAFMQVRSTLKDKMKAKADQMNMKTSTLTKAKSLRGKLTPAQIAQLDVDPEVGIKTLTDLAAELNKKIEGVNNTKTSDWPQFETSAHKLLQDLRAGCDVVHEQLQAMQYLLNERNKVHKASMNHTRYLKSKMGARLIGGGWGKHLSKLLLSRIESGPDATSLTNTVAFDSKVVQVWTGAAEVGKAMLDRLAAFQAQCAAIGAKADIIETTLDQKMD